MMIVVVEKHFRMPRQCVKDAVPTVTMARLLIFQWNLKFFFHPYHIPRSSISLQHMRVEKSFANF